MPDENAPETPSQPQAPAKPTAAAPARLSSARSCDFVDGDSRCSGSKGSGHNSSLQLRNRQRRRIRASRRCVNRCRARCNRCCHRTRSARSAQSEAEESHAARLR